MVGKSIYVFQRNSPATYGIQSRRLKLASIENDVDLTQRNLLVRKKFVVVPGRL